MRTGKRYFIDGADLRFYKGANYVGFKAPSSITTSVVWNLPVADGAADTFLKTDGSGNLSWASSGGAGTVTSVALSLPSIFSVSGSPVTSSGTLTATLVSETQNTFFAAPAGANGTPVFRTIVWADVSSLAGTTSTSFCIGNDSRLHTQNTDTGTTAQSFQLQSGSSGSRIKNASGVIEIRNAADSAYADLVVANLTVQGTTTTVNSETVTVADNIILLNSNETGTPSENAGIEIKRGTSTDATLLWDESNDRWVAGLLGSEIQLARVVRGSFTNATLSAGILTITHGLGTQYDRVTIYDNNGLQIEPDEITATSATVSTVDLSSFGTLTGTWNYVVIG